MAAPQKSGTYMGSITFKTPDGQTLWYVLEVRASEPAEVATIEVNAQVRATRQAGVWGRVVSVQSTLVAAICRHVSPVHQGRRPARQVAVAPQLGLLRQLGTKGRRGTEGKERAWDGARSQHP